MRGIFADVRERNLVRAKCAFDGHAVDFFRTGPAFRRAEDDHRPGFEDRFAARAVRPRLLLNFSYLRVSAIERCGQLLMDARGIVTFDEVRRVTKSAIVGREFVVAPSRRHRGPGNLVAVQMQDRQHRAIAAGIQEFYAFPAAFQRAGFRFSIADHARDDQVRIIERGAKRVHQ